MKRESDPGPPAPVGTTPRVDYIVIYIQRKYYGKKQGLASYRNVTLEEYQSTDYPKSPLCPTLITNKYQVHNEGSYLTRIK